MMSITRKLRGGLLARAAGGLLVCAAPGVGHAGAGDALSYRQPAESLEAALHDVALRSGQAVLAPSRLLAGKRSPPLSGLYTPEQAVRALLTGTDLTVSRVGEALVVRAPRPADPAMTDQPGGARLSEVVVTASHIQGAPPTAPIRTVTRLDIERSGFAQVGDLVRSLPESFSGGQNPGVLSGATSASAGNQNQSNASTVNLRGLAVMRRSCCSTATGWRPTASFRGSTFR
jgi:iron complex outermembrane receptor protein